MTSQTVLRIDDLRVRFAGRDDFAVRGVNLDVSKGEVVALVGESGSGKSVTSFAAMGLLPRTATATGSIRVGGEHEVIGQPDAALDGLRGRVVSMIFQEPMTALNPTMTLGGQIAEAVRNHTDSSKHVALERAVELMTLVGIPDPEKRAGQFPHELSGGQRQRIVIAIALACEPDVIIADEPTTALDVTVQAEILDLLRRLVRERGTGLMIITHNMGVVSDLADRVFVMRHGQVVESGPAEHVLTDPSHEYTRTLLAAIPTLPPAAFGGAEASSAPHEFDAPEDPVILLRGVNAGYRVNGRHVPAVHDIDLAIGAGEFVGLVGESGSGKSTVSRLALGLLPASSGELTLLGQPLNELKGRRARRLLREVGVVFQDPGGSLDPRKTAGSRSPSRSRSTPAGCRARRSARGWPSCSMPCACRETRQADTRTSSRAASASASASPGRSRSLPDCWLPTSRRAPSTCLCRRRCLTCCGACTLSSASGAYLSAMTWVS